MSLTVTELRQLLADWKDTDNGLWGDADNARWFIRARNRDIPALVDTARGALRREAALKEEVARLQARLGEEVLQIVRQSVYSAPQVNRIIDEVARVMARALAQTKEPPND